jgi:stage II sporulation protein D
VPYLRGIVDSDKNYPPGLTASKEAIRGSSDLRLLRQYRQHDFETDWAGRHRWTFEWTQAELGAILSATLNDNQPVGTVRRITELSRGPSGRVLELEIVTDVRTFVVRKDAIRAALRYLDAANEPRNLPSTLFFIEAVDAKGKEIDKKDVGVVTPSGFRVFGAGFGHGVGMAQTGAVGMAEAGYSFDQILKRYYTGIDLVPDYNK